MQHRFRLVGQVFFLSHSRDGTTDVTRTMHFGTPTDHQKVKIVVKCAASLSGWFINCRLDVISFSFFFTWLTEISSIVVMWLYGIILSPALNFVMNFSLVHMMHSGSSRAKDYDPVKNMALHTV